MACLRKWIVPGSISAHALAEMSAYTSKRACDLSSTCTSPYWFYMKSFTKEADVIKQKVNLICQILTSSIHSVPQTSHNLINKHNVPEEKHIQLLTCLETNVGI